MLFVFTTPSRLFRLLYPPSLPPNLTFAMEAVDRLELLQSQAVCRPETGVVQALLGLLSETIIASDSVSGNREQLTHTGVSRISRSRCQPSTGTA